MKLRRHTSAIGEPACIETLLGGARVAATQAPSQLPNLQYICLSSNKPINLMLACLRIRLHRLA